MLNSKIVKKLLFVIQLAVSFGVLLYLFFVLDWPHLLFILSHLRWEYAWLGPVLLLIGLYCLAVRWSLLLTYFGVHLAKTESFIYYLVSQFYNILLPGSISGDAIRIGICAAKKKQAIAKIAMTTLLERVLGLFVVFLVVIAGILLLPDSLHQQLGKPLIKPLFFLSVVALLGFISIWFLLRLIPLSWLKKKKQKVPILLSVVNIVNQIRQISLPGLLTIVGFNSLSQISDIVASYCLAKSILINLPLVIFFVIIPIVYISTALPISLGGLGVREGVLSLLLVRVGIQTSDAISFSLILYFNRVFVALIGGFVQLTWHLPIGSSKNLE